MQATYLSTLGKVFGHPQHSADDDDDGSVAKNAYHIAAVLPPYYMRV